MEERIKVLSLVPKFCTKEQTCKEFNATAYEVKLAKKLLKEQGILPTLIYKNREGLDDASKKVVIDFYENDENSRMCPGAKDCITVKNESGQKEKQQKRLLLQNISELYLRFKEINPTLKIGISKFTELRPKWCIFAGPASTHSVCVCVKHENVKLMAKFLESNDSLTNLLKLGVCDIENENCMLENCEICPGF